MLSFLLVATVTIQSQDAEDRHAAYMAASKGVSVDFTVREASIRTVGRGRIEIQQPNMQKFTLNWGAEKFEFRHSRLGGISIRRDWKEYHESEAIPVNMAPPTMISGIADIGYPAIIGVPTLQVFSGNNAWEHQGTATVHGQKCDKLTISLDSQQNFGSHTVWIDQAGRVQRWNRVFQTQTSQIDIVMDFSNFSQSAPTDLRNYDMTLPIGFVPTQIPFTRTRTLSVAQMAVFGSWMNARTGKHDDVARLVDGVPVAIVFTDPDCEISQTIEPFLRRLRTRLKKEECALIEVSLGRKKPDLTGKDKDRPVYWDRLGSIEKAYGTPGTPYFLLANEDGQLVRGWQGYSKATESEITKELLRAFRD